MNEQKQRVAIAEYRGWKRIEGSNLWLHPNGQSVFKLPDYSSLDAMHEVEKGLKGGKDDEYCELADYHEHLCLVCGDQVEPLNVYQIDLIMATAPQRREAFLRTVGKWEE